MKPSERMWQVMARVEAVSHDGFVLVVIPGWNPGVQIQVPLDDIPAEVARNMEPGYRCFVNVNIGAERVEDLKFDHWWRI